MTGPQHYQAAERLLSQASRYDQPGPDGRPVNPVGAAAMTAQAQVHATLALTAATARPADPTWHAALRPHGEERAGAGQQS